MPTASIALLSIPATPNCTLVELKFIWSELRLMISITPNCTLVELKLLQAAGAWLEWGASKLYLSGIEIRRDVIADNAKVTPNCTLVELKLG